MRKYPFNDPYKWKIYKARGGWRVKRPEFLGGGSAGGYTFLQCLSIVGGSWDED